MEAYVVLGDVVDSREVDDRHELETNLESGCTAVNDRYSDSVLAGFTQLKGIDEIGGLLKTATDLYGVVRTLERHLDPYRIRLAVAAGEIDVGGHGDDVSVMDGPAFHRADELLAEMDSQGYRFVFEANGGPLDTLVTDEINLLLVHRDGLTDRQREVIAVYDERGSQAAAADALGVTQQAVSNALRTASWSLVSTVERRLDGVLGGYDG